MAAADVFTETFRLHPQAVLYAWPSPGQTLAPLVRRNSLRYLLAAGKPGVASPAPGKTGIASPIKNLPTCADSAGAELDKAATR